MTSDNAHLTVVHSGTGLAISKPVIGQLAKEACVVSSALAAMQAMTTLAIDNGEMPQDQVDALNVLLGEIHAKTDGLTNALREIQSQL